MNNESITQGSPIKTEELLSHKVSKGIVWVTVTDICVKIINFISTIILARLLAPSEFGLMAAAMAVISFSQGTTSTGFESAIIQKQDKPERFLNVAWTFELLRCSFLFLIIYFAAPFLSIFFAEPKMVDLLRIISVLFILQGTRNIGVVYFKKNLDFAKQFYYDLIPLIVNVLTVTTLALILRDVWALVWASIASSFCTNIMSYLMHPYRPRVDLDMKKAKELFSFGKWILVSSILVMIRDQGVTMFAGKVFNMSVLGYYNRAGVYSSLIFQQIAEIAWKIGYPAFSQLQHNSQKLNVAFIGTLQILTFIGLPVAGGLYILSNSFVILFLTEIWAPMIPLIKILSLQAAILFINTPASILFQACGRPSISVKISFISIIIFVLTIYPLSMKWGISGTLFSMLLSSLLVTPAIWFMARSLTGLTVIELMKPIIISLINTTLMVYIVLLFQGFIFVEVNFSNFFSLVCIGFISYFAFAVFLINF